MQTIKFEGRVPSTYVSSKGHRPFTQLWWREVTMRDEFWVDFAKKVKPGVINKRIAVVVNVGGGGGDAGGGGGGGSDAVGGGGRSPAVNPKRNTAVGVSGSRSSDDTTMTELTPAASTFALTGADDHSRRRDQETTKPQDHTSNVPVDGYHWIQCSACQNYVTSASLNAKGHCNACARRQSEDADRKVHQTRAGYVVLSDTHPHIKRESDGAAPFGKKRELDAVEAEEERNPTVEVEKSSKPSSKGNGTVAHGTVAEPLPKRSRAVLFATGQSEG